MIFRNKITGKPALWTCPYDPSWKSQDNPNLLRIRSFEDLPFTEDMVHIYSQLNISRVAWEHLGRRGFYFYLREFFYDGIGWTKKWWHFRWNKEIREKRKQAKANGADFWFMFLPCGFPDGKLPEK